MDYAHSSSVQGNDFHPPSCWWGQAEACHHGQWGRMSLKISGEGRLFLSQHPEGRKGKVGGSAPRYLHRRRKLKDGSEPVPGIMHDVLGASAFSPSKPCNAPLTVNEDQARTTKTSIRSVWHGNKEGGPSRTRL
jgi:hypothetical protein